MFLYDRYEKTMQTYLTLTCQHCKRDNAFLTTSLQVGRPACEQGYSDQVGSIIILLFLSLGIYLSVSLSVCMSNSIRLSVYVYLSIYQLFVSPVFLSLSVFLFLDLPIYLSISVHLSVCMASIYSICLSAYLFVNLSQFMLFVFIWLSL